MKNLSLLQAKIAELRTALFFCENPHDLPFSAYLVEVERLDDQGYLWLQINKHNGQGVAGIEPFPVSLEFYRKGVPYTIDIKGMARVTNDSAEGGLLLKITIGQLYYKELFSLHTIPPLEAIGKVFKTLFDIPGTLDDYGPTE